MRGPRRLQVLADHIPWFGAHAGYEQLAERLARRADLDARIVRSRTSRGQIRLGRLHARLRGWPWRNDLVYAAAELRFAWRTRLARGALQHVLYGEGHHHYLERWRKAPRHVIATLHHPPEQWPQFHPSLPANLARLSSALVLWRRDIPRFEGLVGPGRVRFVPHGVDTEFFRPGPPAARTGARRILYAGQNGRNTDMLARVVPALAARHPDLRFDLLVRSPIRQRFAGLRCLLGHPAVRWHERVSDEALRALYHGAQLVLLPFETCGAANTLLEALACGVPVVTTDVGGIPDYGGGSVYPVVANDDDAAMRACAEAYLERPAWRDEVGARCRRFAVQELDWETVAERHVALYRELARPEPAPEPTPRPAPWAHPDADPDAHPQGLDGRSREA